MKRDVFSTDGLDAKLIELGLGYPRGEELTEVVEVSVCSRVSYFLVDEGFDLEGIESGRTLI